MVTNVRYVQSQGYPFVVFDWRGREVAHGWDQTKALLFDLGLVHLGPEWARRVPPIDVVVEGQTTRLQGFVEDPAVWEVVDRFFRALESGRFRPGPA